MCLAITNGIFFRQCFGWIVEYGRHRFPCWQRVLTTFIANLPFSNFAQPPLPCRFQPPLPRLFLLSKWVIVPHLMCYFTNWYQGSTHVKPWYLSTRRTLMCFLCSKFTEVWHIMWFFAGTLIWYQDTRHTLACRLTHPYPTYSHHLLCTHSSYLYYTEWIIHW